MRRILVLALLVAALVAACGGDSEPEEEGSSSAPGSSAPPTSAPPTSAPDPTVIEGEQVEVLALDNNFAPESIQVSSGTEVTFRNGGRNEHNVIPEDEDAEWRVDTEDFQPGDEATFTFSEPGTFRYYCSIHGTIDAGMPGVLVVD